jgi:DNA-binding beta-propeller fold protein YncE
VQSFQIEVTGATVYTNNWDVSAATHTQNFSVSTQSPTASGVFFKPDGTKMYVLEDGISDEIVYQYSLSTAWDVSTASYDSVSFSVGNEDAQTTDLFFSPDGTKMYICGNGSNSILEYSLSTAWVVSSASYSSSISIGTQENTPTGLTFSTDGTKMYVVGFTNQTVLQYSLSTAWDLSTASYASTSFSVSSQETQPESLFFKSDGTKMFVIGSLGDDVNEYDLSTAWDVSTASYGQNFSVSSQQTAPKGIFFKSDGDRMYIVGTTSAQVSEYTVGSSADATLTWPTSIEWAGSVAPAAPANGETDLFTISTDDGGTTYHGFKTADNLS